eukprot:jgi/Mesvir1/2605/Mv13021-RA.1
MNKIDVPFKFSHKLFGIHEVAYLRSTPADGNCLYHAVNLCKAWRERNPEVTYQTLLKLATKLREEARSRLDILIRHAERKSERHPYIEYTDSALNDTKKRLSGNNFANSDIIALLADILRTDIYVISRVFDTSLKRDQFRFQIYESQVGVVRALRPLLIYHNGKKHYEALLPRDSRRTRADYGDHPLLDPKGVLINNLNIRIENHDPPNTGMYTPPLDPYSDAPFRLGRVPYLNDKITHVRASPTGSFFTAVTLAVAMTDPLDTLHLTDNHSKHDKRLSEEDKKLMGRLQGDAQSYNSIQSNDGFLPRLKTEQGMKSVIEDIKNGKITDEIITLAAFEEGREIVILTRVGGNEPHLVTRLWARLYPTNNIGFKRIYLYKGHGGIYEPLRYE